MILKIGVKIGRIVMMVGYVGVGEGTSVAVGVGVVVGVLVGFGVRVGRGV